MEVALTCLASAFKRTQVAKRKRLTQFVTDRILSRSNNHRRIRCLSVRGRLTGRRLFDLDGAGWLRPPGENRWTPPNQVASCKCNRKSNRLADERGN
jgi:hypothetical protein